MLRHLSLPSEATNQSEQREGEHVLKGQLKGQVFVVSGRTEVLEMV